MHLKIVIFLTEPNHVNNIACKYPHSAGIRIIQKRIQRSCKHLRWNALSIIEGFKSLTFFPKPSIRDAYGSPGQTFVMLMSLLLICAHLMHI